MTKEKRNIKELIEKEAPNLNNILEPEDVSVFKAMTEELRDTWTKKQMFRIRFLLIDLIDWKSVN